MNDLFIVPPSHEEAVLAAAMSDLNETCWAAGWLGGCEESIWRLLHGEIDHWGQFTRDEVGDELLLVGRAAVRAESWLVWDAIDGNEGLIPVPLRQWAVAHGNWRDPGSPATSGLVLP